MRTQGRGRRWGRGWEEGRGEGGKKEDEGGGGIYLSVYDW